jgi:hypothetical protein
MPSAWPGSAPTTITLPTLRTQTPTRPTALSSGATPASRTEGERSETEVKAAGVVACSELLDAPPRYAGFSDRAELAPR